MQIIATLLLILRKLWKCMPILKLAKCILWWRGIICWPDKSWSLFVCLFVCLACFAPLENFSLIKRRQHYREGLHILSYARHSWPLNSGGSLACHTYCDTGRPFIMVISNDSWHSHLLPSVMHLSCNCLLGLIRLGFEHLTFRMWGERSNLLRHRRGQILKLTCQIRLSACLIVPRQ